MTVESDRRFQELLKVKDILTQVDYSTLRGILDQYLPNVPYCMRPIENRPFQYDHGSRANFIYRARVVKPGQKRWDRVSEISYIPEDKLHLIREFGRINQPHQSVFYGSLGAYESIFEITGKGEDMINLISSGQLIPVVVGTWEVVEPIAFCRVHLPVEETKRHFEADVIKKLGLRAITMDTVVAQAEDVRRLLNNEDMFRELGFFSEAFARVEINDHREYMLSNYYAERAFGLNPTYRPSQPIEGIQYFGILSSFQQLNVAMLPETVDRKLRFHGAHLIGISRDESTGQALFVPFQQNVRAVDGVIQWRH